ncbi:coat protein F [Alicyclobacillus herbarius]|uniref:coat protein F n=1 Tax=Alicyclobacillus herbarius TaxID=122960 RepID=UPI002351F7CF|nr:coat protein F [Alicyclobacillus herbarius]
MKLPPESDPPMDSELTSKPESETRGHHLAPHETLELHELLAFQANNLARQKMVTGKIHDPALCALYLEAISAGERCICELMEALKARAPLG